MHHNAKYKYRKMSQFRRRVLFFTACAFSFSVSCSITATLAYYSISRVFSIEHLNINIQSIDAELYLGVNKGGEIVYGDKITQEDIDLSYDGLLPVSAMFSESWLNNGEDNKTKLPKFCSAYGMGTSKNQTSYASEGYVQKEFYLKATQDCSLYLSEDTFFQANYEKNKYTAETYGLSLDELNEVTNSIRMSFFMDDPNNYVIINPGNSKETYFGGLLDLDLDGYYDYDHESKKEYAYGEVVGSVTYLDQPLIESSPYKDSKSTFIANHSSGVYMVDNNKTNYKKEPSRKLDEVIIKNDEGSTKNKPICVLHKDIPQRIVLSIYLEGWDTHCVDSLKRASLDVSVLFTALFNI